jgi:hypothetical protein
MKNFDCEKKATTPGPSSDILYHRQIIALFDRSNAIRTSLFKRSQLQVSSYVASFHYINQNYTAYFRRDFDRGMSLITFVRIMKQAFSLLLSKL